jgi:hypothetical protein
MAAFKTADARDGEHLLDDEGTGEDAGEGGTEERHDGEERAA